MHLRWFACCLEDCSINSDLEKYVNILQLLLLLFAYNSYKTFPINIDSLLLMLIYIVASPYGLNCNCTLILHIFKVFFTLCSSTLLFLKVLWFLILSSDSDVWLHSLLSWMAFNGSIVLCRIPVQR